MVDPTLTNQWTNIAYTWSGFFLIKAGSTWYRYKRLSALNGSNSQGQSDHYGDDGNLQVAPVSLNSTYTVTVDETSDMFEAVDTPVDTKSISYIIGRMFQMKSIPVEFDAVDEAEMPTDGKYIHNHFKGYITDVGHPRNNGSGVYERTLTIRCTELVEVIRTATDAPE